MEELIKKSDARRAILKHFPQAAFCLEDIKPVNAVVPREAVLIERVVNHDFPSNTVLECSACMAHGEEYHRFCHMCGAKFKEITYVRTV